MWSEACDVSGSVWSEAADVSGSVPRILRLTLAPGQASAGAAHGTKAGF